MKTDIGINNDQILKIVAYLEQLLADEHVLLIKTRNFHWNVHGLQFVSFHELFEEQYNALNGFVDEIAERIRMLGEQSPGSMAEFLRISRLSEISKNTLNVEQMLELLLSDHESIIKWLREAITHVNDSCNDAGTADFLTGLLQAHEKMAWMLRASLR